MRLYNLPLSPFCRKIRLVLFEKKIEFELFEEKVWEKRMDFLRINPACKVPVLTNKNLIIADSNAIFEYLEEKYPFPSLLSNNLIEKAEIRRIVGWFDDKFHNEVTKNLLYEKINKKLSKTGQPDSNNIKIGTHNIKFHIDYLDWLLEKRKWLAGNNMTIADLTAASHISVLDYLGDIDWERSDFVKNWYYKVKSRPSFRTLLTDFLPGFIPSSHYMDLDF
tara:strand:+ start:625 stop:1287 length:663 start_codon:yes stop_codon:yes gene_type:complete